MNERVTESDIACTLNDREFKERRLLVCNTVLAHVTDRQRKPNGILLHFKESPDVRAQVETFVALERQCCGFLTFTISQPHEDLSLFIEAPKAGLETLDRLASAISADD